MWYIGLNINSSLHGVGVDLQMGDMYCPLDDLLKLLNTNKSQLHKSTGIRKTTLSLLGKNKLQRLELEYSILILDFLNETAEKKGIQRRFNMHDLFIYTYKKES